MSLFNRVNGGRTNTGAQNRETCRFYLEGRCRFGDECRFYHPPRDSQNSHSSAPNRGQLPYHLNIDGIRSDLTFQDDRPEWRLSCYGPGRDAPRQLIEGVLEQSLEEMRLLCYIAQASGSTQAYEQHERSLQEQANQQAQQILNDIDGAVKYVIDAKDQHPNREDLVVKSAGNLILAEVPGTAPVAASTTFGGGQTPAFGATGNGSAFGQPSTFGNKPSTGGAAFGQPATPGAAASAFAQPSALGSGTSAFGAASASGSAFGKPSALGGGGASAFGQPSTLGGSSPFGAQSTNNNQGSAFGQPSAPNQQPSAFGQPSAPASGSTFGNPSPFRAAASSGSAFGQPSAIGQQQSAFGQPSAPGQQTSPFGKTSPFAAAAAAPTAGSAFGQPSQPGTQSTFDNQSPFGAASNGTSAFGKPSAPGQQQSPFGGGQQPSSTPFGATTAAPSNPFAATNGTSTQVRTPGQPPKTWKGQPVFTSDKAYFYNDPTTRRKERIWHPEGPPGSNADVEAAPPSIYDDGALGAVLKGVYDYVRETGTFRDGLVPEIPPRREWVSWDI